MNFNFDTGTIDTIQTLDPTTLPPLGGNLNVLTIFGTGALGLPSGLTGTRPAGAVGGWIRYNSTIFDVEYFNGNTASWQKWVNTAGDTMSGVLNMGNNKITNVTDPTAAQDAATKAYVDSVSTGLSWKTYARAATTVNGTLATAFAAGQTIDGVTLALNDRILIKNQTTQTDNGIYLVTAGTPTRTTDADTGAELVNAAIFIAEGTVNSDTAWVQTANAPITIGVTNITFVQFAGLGTTVPINYLSAATATNSFNNANFQQTWNWSLTAASVSALKIAENAASTGGAGSQFLLDVETLATSTADPFRVVVRGTENFKISRTGEWQIAGSVGTAGQALLSNGAGTAPTWQANVATNVPLSGITAATTGNSINNGDNAQVWNWALTTAAKTAFDFTENTAATNGAGSQFLVDISTIAASTANPIRIRAQGNNILTVTNVGVTTLQGADSTTGQTITIKGGNSSTAATAGASATLLGGTSGTSGTGGTANVTGGVGGTTGVGGAALITGGAGGTTSGNAGGVTITGGTPVAGAGGAISISGSNGVGTNQNAGGITLLGGNPTGTGTPGSISLTGGALQGAGTPATVSLTGGAGNGATTGGAVTILGGTGGTTGTGAVVTVTGGPGGSTSGNAGAVTVAGGTPTDGNGGAVNITGSAGVGTNRSGGNVTDTGGNATGTGTGGNLSYSAGSGGATGTAGTVTITGGAGGSTSGNAGAITIVGGTPTAGAGAAINITGSAGVGTNQNGGNVVITAGAATGTGTTGEIRNTTTNGAVAVSDGNFAAFGDAVQRTRIMRNSTTNATGTELFLDGSATRFALVNNSSYTFDILITARRTDATGGRAAYRFVGIISKDTTNASTTFTGTPSKTVIGETNAAWDATVAADTTNGALTITVTGEAAKTIRWVAAVTTTETTN